MERHADVDLAIGVDTLEVDVLDLLAEGVHLVVTQQHRLHGTVELEIEDGRVECFLAHRVKQRVVVDLDGFGRLFAAVNNTGNLASATQAAARTRTLQRALGRNDFDFHGVSPLSARFRDQSRARVRTAGFAAGMRRMPLFMLTR